MQLISTGNIKMLPKYADKRNSLLDIEDYERFYVIGWAGIPEQQILVCTCI